MTNFELKVFGGFEAYLNKEPIHFQTIKERALLVYLAVNANREVERRVLAALLWEDLTEKAARKNLRQTIMLMRGLLADIVYSDGTPLFEVNRYKLKLNVRSSEAKVDVFEFDELIEACRVHSHRDTDKCWRCVHRLTRAIGLYDGEVLAAFHVNSTSFSEWQLIQQETRVIQLLTALNVLTSNALSIGEFEYARELAQFQLQQEPWLESAHRQMILAYAFSGEKEAALEHYTKCEQILAKMFGTVPINETKLLYEKVKNDELVYTAFIEPTASLPLNLTPFFGRVSELNRITKALLNFDDRFVSIIGEGGIGKTRLAVAAAKKVRKFFPDGVWFVALESIEKNEDFHYLETVIAKRILECVGVTPLVDEDIQQALFDWLPQKHLLLILDGFEHLLNCRGFIEKLLDCAEDVMVLVTSRERLHITGELAERIFGLEVPQRIQQTPTDSMALFAEHATRRSGYFRITPENWRNVQKICAYLNGNPLAIQLAAPWVNTLTLDELLRSIKTNDDILESSFVDTESRHQSIHAVFEHSWRLLDSNEQFQLAQLSVFSGHFSEQDALYSLEIDAASIRRFEEKSFLLVENDSDYIIHDLLRKFLKRKLNASGAEEIVKKNHATYFLRWLSRQRKALVGENSAQAQKEISSNYDNLLAAWNYAIQQNQVLLLIRATPSLGRYCFDSGLLSEGLTRFSSTLDVVRTWEQYVTDHNSKAYYTLLALILIEKTRFLNSFGRNSAEETIREAIKIGRSIDDKEIHARALFYSAHRQASIHNMDKALEQIEEALLLQKNGKQTLLSGHLHSLRGFVLTHSGKSLLAKNSYQTAAQIAATFKDRNLEAVVLGNLSSLHFISGDFEAGLDVCQRMLTLVEQQGSKMRILWAHQQIAKLKRNLGEFESAREHLLKSLNLAKTVKNSFFTNIAVFELTHLDIDLGSAISAPGNIYEPSISLEFEEASNLDVEYCQMKTRLFLHKNDVKSAVLMSQRVLEVTEKESLHDNSLALAYYVYALIADEQYKHAAEAAKEALEKATVSDDKPLSLEISAQYAFALLYNQQYALADKIANDALKLLNNIQYLNGTIESSAVCNHLIEVFSALNNNEAEKKVAEIGRNFLSHRATRISNDELRYRYLNVVRPNAKLVQLAAERGFYIPA